MAKRPAGIKVINIDQLAEMFDLPSWDDVDELNRDYYWEMTRGAEDEEAAEQEVQSELYAKWHDAVEYAAEQLFSQHALELAPVGVSKKIRREWERPYEYRVQAPKGWSRVAGYLRTTAEGYGLPFEGTGTAANVLKHLGIIGLYPEVYGGQSARRMFDTHFS